MLHVLCMLGSSVRIAQVDNALYYICNPCAFREKLELQNWLLEEKRFAY